MNPAGTATLATGTPFQAGLQEPTLTVGALSLAFAFTNVSGCTEGPQVSFVAGTPPPVGTVGTSPINVLVVYVPQGGGNGGDTGAVIDAFNETTGSLVNNDFVTVSPDSGGTLTSEANVDGWVDTTDSGYTITADHPNIGPYLALPTNAVFDQWVVLADPSPPSSLVSGDDLTPGKGVTVYALAFYKKPIFKKLWSKDHKEIKEEIGEVYKPTLVDVPFKAWTSEGPWKGPKESVEVSGYGNIGDPAELIAAELQSLNQRLSSLEASLKGASKGAAFIKAEDRPAVGKAAAKKPNKSR